MEARRIFQSVMRRVEVCHSEWWLAELYSAAMPISHDALLYKRYRILSELGRGGMGAVFFGHDENLGVDVAIKENLFVSPEFADQFRREATLLATLRHPNLPRVTDHFVIDGEGQYLVMDYIAGEDLRQRLEAQNGEPLSEPQVLRWARDILEALKYLHVRPQPVVHRDIKPGNIKVTPEGRAVLVDFGLAKLHDASQATASGAKALSPGFSPPEQYGGGRTDLRSDVYALGATLYALLTCQPPADGLRRALGHDPLVPIVGLNPSVSPHVAAVIERSLAVRPSDRYAGAAEFLAALFPELTRARAPQRTKPKAPAELTIIRQPTRTSPAVPAAPEAPDALPARHRSRLRLAIAAALFVLATGGGIGVLALGYNFVRGGLPAFLAVPSFTAVQSQVPSATGTPPATALAAASATLPPALAPTGTPVEATPLPAATATPAASATEPPAASPTPAAAPIGGGAGTIAFASERNGAAQIYLMNADGSDVTQLTDVDEGACQPAWSPDGQQLLFVTPCAGKNDRYPRSAIYIVNVDGSGLRPFVAVLGGAYDPDWSVGGIAFVHLDGGRPQIYLAAADGNGVHRISGTRSADNAPAWSPDGSKLAFRNITRSVRPTLFWMFADGTFKNGGSNPDALTRDVDASAPAWSPDGRYVAFIAGQQIMLVEWNTVGFGVQALTTAGPNADPTWSPDSQWLVFESWRDGAVHDLYRLASTGGQLVRLTNDSALDFQPAWRP